MLIYSILTLLFLAGLSISLYFMGYYDGKTKGIQEGRKDLADYVLREKVRS